VKDVMIDLETLGTQAGCGIVSIGAVPFDEFDVSDNTFYKTITQESNAAAGLGRSNETMAWWHKQSPEARAVLSDPAATGIARALTSFSEWLAGIGSDVRAWGNGADFDLPILGGAYNAVGLPVPWKPYNGRCYRTVKNGYKAVKLQRKGTHHNALDDAVCQAQHLVDICQLRGWRLA